VCYNYHILPERAEKLMRPSGITSWTELMEATHGMLAINLMRPSGLLKRWCDRPHRKRFVALHLKRHCTSNETGRALA
jgi:hypothetical protein